MAFSRWPGAIIAAVAVTVAIGTLFQMHVLQMPRPSPNVPARSQGIPGIDYAAHFPIPLGNTFYLEKSGGPTWKFDDVGFRPVQLGPLWIGQNGYTGKYQYRMDLTGNAGLYRLYLGNAHGHTPYDYILVKSLHPGGPLFWGAIEAPPKGTFHPDPKPPIFAWPK